MRKINRTKDDAVWLAALGKHLKKLVHDKGYKSIYDFWTEVAGDEISRASLNYILNGEVNLKVTTLKKLAAALNVEPKEILNFKIR